MKTSLTSKTLKQHLTYSWWKYLLVVAVAIGLVDLLYSVTAYRSPRDKTLGVYVYGYMDEQGLTDYLTDIRETELSDMEQVSCMLLTNDATYGPMQLMTYLAAGEGDLYVLPREEFLNYAASGSLVPLEEDSELLSLFDAAGVSLQSGWRRETESGETHLYGIPLEKIPGSGRYVYAEDGYLCMIVPTGNQPNALKLLRILCKDWITEPDLPPAEASSDPTAQP